ncbi:probable serine/threonine-protein kinase DDB_G0280111 [Amborella trichopoda]|uniref:non-specific serine/threonine protein kinase n=1 Tax=Amborella trichopoda TaxID=13333 RepID=W1PV61_AMBTC|nr:probable serine/threonine-protein kinase DDB_G0280111 [Amborella trichopoda]ERN11601.1 hypothetical protein AMTR_s00022p00186280 [Amborella trichopoda]|eukprot:XP_006850020.1 probable serine/threonine-protein kinase DDB_G0280111 [Amborella trichopoda]
MWRLKQFMPKEPLGLEGRSIDIGNLKVQVRNTIAEGGFSSVYLVRDVGPSGKQFAMKHIFCNDEETLDLVKKEFSVMKSLKGHPNVVALQAHTILDMGRTKEAFLVMEFCEKSLVTVLENRGAAYFEEKQILLIFRDVCNAVFAMHCQNPAIAHRDLKAENVLLSADGTWKLCDFGSASTNHKRFERPEEMGIEEDNIRKHTTPAYRAPEMWDLFRREVINEKVDIWALGCLLYRICYLKSAFDGESKLQILNGNYRIPELPKYSSAITGLIKDMLQASPDTRPDIMQVWSHVNEQLPVELQKQAPEKPASMAASEAHMSSVNGQKKEGVSPHSRRTHVMPRRTAPSPPTPKEQNHRSPSVQVASQGSGSSLGAFWMSHHAQTAAVSEDKGPVFDEESKPETFSKHSPPKDHQRPGLHLKRSGQNVIKRFDDGPSEDFEIRFYSEEAGPGSSENLSNTTVKSSNNEASGLYKNEAFGSFVTDFDGHNVKEDSSLQGEVERLREQLKQVVAEKAEVASKYEKLTAICRSQRQEIQELKQAIAAGSNRDNSKVGASSQSQAQQSHKSPGSWQSGAQRDKIEGSIWELQEGMQTNNTSNISPDSKPWQAFTDTPAKIQPPPSKNSNPKQTSTRPTNGHQTKQTASLYSSADAWGFGQDGFVAANKDGPHITKTSTQASISQRFAPPNPHIAQPKSMDDSRTQPAGWAGF